MATWSASAYPPSRRSRSRSPYRGGSYGPRPPHPDPAFPNDPYRTDWDAYDRDRAWASYDRERAAFEYSRRGRSRSPGDDASGTGRKRRRSTSPWERDRYEPRPRYDDYDPHRGHGGYSPRRGQHPPYSSRNAPPDPHTFDYPASLKQYAEWFRYYYPQQAIEEDNADKAAEHEAGDGSKPRNGIRSKWEKYKKEFASHQLQRMFEHHRKSPWFAEKYDPSPEFVNLRTRLRREGWKGRLGTFFVDLESGKYDSSLNEQEQDPATPAKEASANGALSEIPEIADLGPAGPDTELTKPAVDEEMQNVDGDEEGGENETGRQETNGKGPKDSKHNNRGEEVSVMPDGNQVMIRTIPPDIGRLKLEEACGKVAGYIYLALGDPLQKRNYYRAGWLKFQEDADMPAVMTELSDKKIEGFKLHVTHNMKPFTNRVRYAPEVASKPERMVKDLTNIKILTSLLEEEHERVRKPPREKKVETDGATEEGANGSVPLDDTVMAEPSQRTDNDAEDDEPKEKGSDAVERRIEKNMAELRESGTVDPDDEQEIDRRRVAISLDLYISYLRAAFNTCFYCAVVTDHVEELQRKCVKHVRKPMSQAMLEEIKATAVAEVEQEAKEKKVADTYVTDKSGVEDGENDDQDMMGEKQKDLGSKEKEGHEPVVRERGFGENRDWKRNDERWLDWFDSKIALLINRDGVDPRNYGGKDYDEELSKATEPFIKQEDEGKFRCKTCLKLFKATSFVEKHVANKHPELVKFLQDISYFNNFALDPHRIQPFTHAPAPIGNSQQPPPQAYGLQGPAYPPTGDFGRMPPYYGSYGPGYVAYPPAGGYWDYYQSSGYGAVPAPPSRRDDFGSRRLSDRISGYAHESGESSGLPLAAGLPPKPVGVESGGGRRGRGGTGGSAGGPLPPPPPNAKEDPRAAAGKKVSYHDMDLVAEGDVELNY